MYIHASVKTQVLIHPAHCITERAQFMLHSHGFFCQIAEISHVVV